MKEDLYITLIHKNLSGDITAEEKSQLTQWLKDSPDNQLIADHITQSWNLSGDFSTEVDLDLDNDFAQLQKKIVPSGNKKATKVAKERSIQPRRQWLSIAAGLLFLVVAGFLLRNFLGGSGKMLIVKTGAEETKSIELPDGSTIKLNKNTEFRYPENFRGGQRNVEINGEAFFDVAKDANKPFVITTPSSVVTVLGTSFSVNDYKSRPNAIVSVKEGKVKLQPKGKTKNLILKGKERGVYKKSFHKLVKNESFSFNSFSWHTNTLVFDNTPLGEVFGAILNHYGAQMYAEKSEILQCKFTGTFENQNFDVLLKAIVAVYGFEVENVRNKSFRLMGGSCEGE